jgi:hypothetical protein
MAHASQSTPSGPTTRTGNKVPIEATADTTGDSTNTGATVACGN